MKIAAGIYTPRPDYNGTDSFTYKVKDSNGEFSDPVTVTVNIAGKNDAPVLTGSVPEALASDSIPST